MIRYDHSLPVFLPAIPRRNGTHEERPSACTKRPCPDSSGTFPEMSGHGAKSCACQSQESLSADADDRSELLDQERIEKSNPGRKAALQRVSAWLVANGVETAIRLMEVDQ